MTTRKLHSRSLVGHVTRISLALILSIAVTTTVQAQAPTGFLPGDGLFTIHAIDISAGGTDADINNTLEARDILDFVRTLPAGTTGIFNVPAQGASTYNITTNALSTASELDYGGGGDFGVNNPFPAGMSGDQFIIGVSGGIAFQPNTYTLGLDGDDGSQVIFAPPVSGDPAINFFNEVNEEGGTAGDNELIRNSPTGNHDTRAAFTIATETVTTFDIVWNERTGGDRWEVSLGLGDTTGAFPPSDLLQNGLFGGSNAVLLNSVAFEALPIPEPSAALLSILALGSLGMIFWRRRR